MLVEWETKDLSIHIITVVVVVVVFRVRLDVVGAV